jgi:hypothetical protein
MKLEARPSNETWKQWKVVNCEDYRDVPGEIKSADTDTGIFVFAVPKIENGYVVVVDGKMQTEPKEFRWAPHSFKIVGR